ncbi:hypothetical protein V2J09_018983 [Rumex salicifolius]
MYRKITPTKHSSSAAMDGEHKSSRKPSTATQELLWFSLVSAAVKILLIPAYRSTDFEVHRNWLAVTHSLPLRQWYSDSTSPWTLDYPPFFAFFELVLSQFAAFIDPTIVDLHRGLNYSADSVVLFQRISVIVSDFVLHYSIYRISRNLDPNRRRLIWILVIWSPALLIVDHIHFQYNGLLLGLLILSISALMEGRDLFGGFVFAGLLCFKHLFAVAAPVYFVYLFRHYCRGGLFRGFGRLLVMGTAVAAVFAAAFGPFVYNGQILQVIQRMFPFGRGLCHAYWAPNFWVFYIILDKILAFILRKLGFSIQRPSASFTGGLVGDSSPFSVLPRITPMTTLVIVLLTISPILYKAWRNPKPAKTAKWIAYAYTCGFLFGWHVHEKASLHFVIPLAIVAANSAADAKHYFILATVSSYSLLPLLFEAREYPIKVLLLLLHSTLIYFGFSSLFPGKAKPEKDGSGDDDSEKQRFSVGWVGASYVFGLVFIELWSQIIHPKLFGDRLPFLPLLLSSTYCAFGMLYSWIWQLRSIMASSH